MHGPYKSPNTYTNIKQCFMQPPQQVPILNKYIIHTHHSRHLTPNIISHNITLIIIMNYSDCQPIRIITSPDSYPFTLPVTGLLYLSLDYFTCHWITLPVTGLLYLSHWITLPVTGLIYLSLDYFTCHLITLPVTGFRSSTGYYTCFTLLDGFHTD